MQRGLRSPSKFMYPLKFSSPFNHKLLRYPSIESPIPQNSIFCQLPVCEFLFVCMFAKNQLIRRRDLLSWFINYLNNLSNWVGQKDTWFSRQIDDRQTIDTQTVTPNCCEFPKRNLSVCKSFQTLKLFQKFANSNFTTLCRSWNFTKN